MITPNKEDWRELEDMENNIREVETIDYGEFGCKPKNPQDCFYGGEVSCICRSGDSLCGGCHGTGDGIVFCTQPLKE